MTRAAPRALLACVAAALAFTACNRTADLLPRLAPASTVLELRTTRVSGDTAFLALHLTGTGAPVLGSVTASVALNAGEWAFAACAPVAPAALVACHQGDSELRIAAAWASGAPAGALVTLTLTRKSGTAAPVWRLSALELHSAFGHSLIDSITVRREGAP